MANATLILCRDYSFNIKVIISSWVFLDGSYFLISCLKKLELLQSIANKSSFGSVDVDDWNKVLVLDDDWCNVLVLVFDVVFTAWSLILLSKFNFVLIIVGCLLDCLLRLLLSLRLLGDSVTTSTFNSSSSASTDHRTDHHTSC